jgi:hypothetical protein
MKGYPRFFSVRLITLVVFVLFLSGLFLAPTTLIMRLEWELPWRLASDQRVWMAALHAFFAFVMLLVIGALWPIHMRVEWRRGRNLYSGIAMAFTWAILILTGLGIYYLGNEQLAIWTSVGHLVLGLVIVLFYFWHVFLFDKEKNALIRIGRAKPNS